MTYGVYFHSIFIPGHKFVVEIANSYQIWNLEITLVLKLTILMGISKSCICLYFSILTTNLCPGMKIEWEIYPICQCLEHVLKIFQIRWVCAKKINNNPCTFLVLKVASAQSILMIYDIYLVEKIHDGIFYLHPNIYWWKKNSNRYINQQKCFWDTTTIYLRHFNFQLSLLMKIAEIMSR